MQTPNLNASVLKFSFSHPHSEHTASSRAGGTIQISAQSRYSSPAHPPHKAATIPRPTIPKSSALTSYGASAQLTVMTDNNEIAREAWETPNGGVLTHRFSHSGVSLAHSQNEREPEKGDVPTEILGTSLSGTHNVDSQRRELQFRARHIQMMALGMYLSCRCGGVCFSEYFPAGGILLGEGD